MKKYKTRTKEYKRYNAIKSFDVFLDFALKYCILIERGWTPENSFFPKGVMENRRKDYYIRIKDGRDEEI